MTNDSSFQPPKIQKTRSTKISNYQEIRQEVQKKKKLPRLVVSVSREIRARKPSSVDRHGKSVRNEEREREREDL